MLAATAIMASSAAVMGVSADETTPTNGADYSVDDAIVDQDRFPKQVLNGNRSAPMIPI